jgi:ATP-dependent Lon protease
MSNPQTLLDNFSGVTRLFPLPNLVVFPHVAQPLQIVEPPLIRLLQDALASDQLLATSLLLPVGTPADGAPPPIDPILCLAQIASCSRASDGRFDILVAGISRAELIRELPVASPYRQVEIEILADREPGVKPDELAQLQHRLRGSLRQLFGVGNAEQRRQLDEMLNGYLHLGALTDLMAYALPLDLSVKQVLLAEVDIVQRARLLLEQLRIWSGRRALHTFPPDFSLN